MVVQDSSSSSSSSSFSSIGSRLGSRSPYARRTRSRLLFVFLFLPTKAISFHGGAVFLYFSNACCSHHVRCHHGSCHHIALMIQPAHGANRNLIDRLTNE